ncbi:zinc ribbon domain-containing protein [Streptomyces sp. NPDC002790]|uniref:zinc ribbon domain-containing protein n=1 Tax=Streptomyces sp. NPDC002790 TaxID=3154431 RepID=UPI0033266A2B
MKYKARQAGVPFLEVDPAYTSQRCPRCGHTAKANRPDRDHFCCHRCGVAGRSSASPTCRRSSASTSCARN